METFRNIAISSAIVYGLIAITVFVYVGWNFFQIFVYYRNRNKENRDSNN